MLEETKTLGSDQGGICWYPQESPQFATSPEDWLWMQQTVEASVILTFLEWDLFESSMQMATISFTKCVRNMYLWIFLRTHRLGSFFPYIIRHNVFILMVVGNQSSAGSQRIMVKFVVLSESRGLVQCEISDRDV